MNNNHKEDKEKTKYGIKYGEYMARIEVKDSIGTSQSVFTTWRADIISDILAGAQAHMFKKGGTVIIEIIPKDQNFTNGLFTEI